MATKQQLKNIPLHQIEVEHAVGFWLKYIDEYDLSHLDDQVQEAHRDDHYVFFLQEQGQIDIILDFELVRLRGKTLGFILPGQVHYYKPGVHKSTGWFLAIASEHIDVSARAVFENKLLNGQQVKLKDTGLFTRNLTLIYDLLQDQKSINTRVIHHLLNAFMGMVANYFSAGIHALNKPVSRISTIASDFRQLVSAHFISHKSPAAYSALLNISPAYLNEAVKKQTGFSTTYWIQQETILEAKRLLYHTNLTVKEIAYKTGFEDHAYFSRLFHKTAEMTPLDFRRKYRESSNLHR